jgi:hypothetical protein
MLSPYESLHSASRRALRSRSKAGELTLGLVVGVGLPRFHVGAAEGCDLLIFVGIAPHPALSRGRGGRFVGFSECGFNSVSHVDVPRQNTPISPLSLWERARVRVCFWLFKFASAFQGRVQTLAHWKDLLSLTVLNIKRKIFISNGSPNFTYFDGYLLLLTVDGFSDVGLNAIAIAEHLQEEMI